MTASTSAAATSTDTLRPTIQLWTSAQRAARDNSPALSRVLLLAARDRGLPERAQSHACAKCFTLLIPGASCSPARLAKRRRRPAARRRELVLRCNNCGHLNSSAAANPPSARSAIAAAEPEPAANAKASKAGGKRAAAPPTKGKSAAPAAANARKKPRAAAKPASTAAASSGGGDAGYFGFDFVPTLCRLQADFGMTLAGFLAQFWTDFGLASN